MYPCRTNLPSHHHVDVLRPNPVLAIFLENLDHSMAKKHLRFPPIQAAPDRKREMNIKSFIW